MSENLICSKCGSQYQIDDCFCRECGHQLQEKKKNYLEEYETNAIKGNNGKLNQNKKGKITGFILILLGIMYMIFVNYYDGVGPFVMGLLLLAYGLILLFKRVNKYGWGIGASITIGVLLGSIYPFQSESFMGSLVLSFIFIYLLLKANIKKKGE